MTLRLNVRRFTLLDLFYVKLLYIKTVSTKKEKECDSQKNNSHIAHLQFAFRHLIHRILSKFHRNVFLPHSEGAVGPILNSAFHEKDLQTSNSIIVLLGKTTRHAILS